MPVRDVCRFRGGRPAAVECLFVVPAGFLKLVDGVVVGDLVPVAVQIASGQDAAQPERVRGHPVDHGEDERERFCDVAAVRFGDAGDEPAGVTKIRLGRGRGGQSELRTHQGEPVEHRHGGIGPRFVFPPAVRPIRLLRGEMSRRDSGVICFRVF